MCLDRPAKASRIRAWSVLAVPTDGRRVRIVWQLDPPTWWPQIRPHDTWQPQWKFPGGGVSPHQTLQQAASSEYAEETGEFVPAYQFNNMFQRIVSSDSRNLCRQCLMTAQVEESRLDRGYPDPIEHLDTADHIRFLVWSVEYQVLRELSRDSSQFLQSQQEMAAVSLARFAAMYPHPRNI